MCPLLPDNDHARYRPVSRTLPHRHPGDRRHQARRVKVLGGFDNVRCLLPGIYSWSSRRHWGEWCVNKIEIENLISNWIKSLFCLFNPKSDLCVALLNHTHDRNGRFIIGIVTHDAIHKHKFLKISLEAKFGSKTACFKDFLSESVFKACLTRGVVTLERRLIHPWLPYISLYWDHEDCEQWRVFADNPSVSWCYQFRDPPTIPDRDVILHAVIILHPYHHNLMWASHPLLPSENSLANAVKWIIFHVTQQLFLSGSFCQAHVQVLVRLRSGERWMRFYKVTFKVDFEVSTLKETFTKDFKGNNSLPPA